jgi:hypothetical protein
MERNIRGEIGWNSVRDSREEIRKYPGLGGVLKRTVAKSGLAMLYRMLPTSFETVDEGLP